MKDTGTFFITTPLKFEHVALEEIKEKATLFGLDLDISAFRVEAGGIEAELPLHIGFVLNHILKVPTRILLRIDSFKCRDFPKLHKKISKIDWRNFLIGQYPKIDATTKKSRIINTKRAEETIHSGIAKYYKANTPKQADQDKARNAHTILFIRVINDHCTVSIDTSGDRLNIRGERTLVGTAPIRENLAAGLIYSLAPHFKDTDTFVDPMCGAGTTLIEARDFYKANYNREFSYQAFPLFKKEKEVVLAECNQTLFQKFYGYDIDSKMVDVAKQNVKDSIEIDKRDAAKVYDGVKDVAIFINPPYGQRIIPDNKLDRFYTNAIEGLITSYSPKILAMIIPKTLKSAKIDLPEGHKLEELYRFKNGGLAVKLIAITRS